MPDKLDESVVRHVGKLARLELSNDEVAACAEQIAEILAYIDQLNEVDTTNVAPTEHVLEIRNVLRDDVPREGWTPDQALRNAPARRDGFFRVPKVLEQEDV